MISAPEMGPDFWRIIQETPESYANVTLLFKVIQTSFIGLCICVCIKCIINNNEMEQTVFYSFFC